MDFDEFAISVLSLLDLALLGCLVLLVTLSGYENFVSKIKSVEGHKSRLLWMGHLDFSGMKLKITSSVVTISLIELLRDFLEAGSTVDPNIEIWRVILHLVFLIFGLILACMAYLGEKKIKKEFEGL